MSQVSEYCVAGHRVLCRRFLFSVAVAGAEAAGSQRVVDFSLSQTEQRDIRKLLWDSDLCSSDLCSSGATPVGLLVGGSSGVAREKWAHGREEATARG